MRASKFVENKAAHERLLKEGLAELKMDGARGLLHLKGKTCEMFSRHVSVKTGELVNNSELVPHLVDPTRRHLNYSARVVKLKKPWTQLKDTILDGEVVSQGGNKSYDVQTIMGCLPSKAVERQHKEGWVEFRVFDCLRYEGRDLINEPLKTRLKFLDKALAAIDNPYIKLVERKPKNISVHDWVKAVWDQGCEGVILKDLNSKYAMNQAPANSWLKFKKELTAEVVVLGFLAAKEESTKVTGVKSATKYKGMVGAVIYGYVTKKFVYSPKASAKVLKTTEKAIAPMLYGVTKKGKMINVADSDPIHDLKYYFKPIGTFSGIDDSMRVDMTDHPEKYIGRVVELKFQEWSKNAPRHPRFVRFRNDKTYDECTLQRIKQAIK